MASSFLEKKAKKQAEELEKKYGSSAYGGTTWLNEQLTGKTTKKKTSKDDDIAPVAKKKEEEERSWFKASDLWDDGYQLGDITKTILGTGEDLAKNIGTGIVGIGEKVVDAFATVSPYVSQAMWNMNGGDTTRFLAPEVAKQHDELIEQSKKDAAKFVAKDLYDEQKVAEFIIDHSLTGVTNKGLGVDSKAHSVFGEKSDALAQSGGQLLGQLAANAIAPGSGLALMGVTSFGSEAESALMNDATLDEALLSGAISAGAEMLTEKLGGISFGGKTWTDAAFSNLSRHMTSKLAKVLITTGKVSADALVEGGEEILSGYMSAIGQKLTYMNDKEITELFSNEDALESFIGGAVLGGLGGAGDAVKSAAQGVDPISGLNKNEKAVVDKEYNSRLEEAEANGKLTEKEKNKLYDSVVKDMERGYISTDTIEEVLGDRSSYDALSKEAEEYDTLYNTPSGQLSKAQQDRLTELDSKNKANPYKDALNVAKDQYSQSVFELVKGDRLSESYNERARRGQVFEADLTQYDAKQQAVIQKAVESGILNNTNRTHEFVDMIAKISADKGVLFDFTNNAKLKDSGFAVDGKAVNGYVTKDGITLNIDSAKSLNSVVGHEITHVLEGTELYDALKQTVFEYAKSKGEYDSRLSKLTETYKSVKDADIDAELAADLVGDYLFTDSDFIHRLSTENRNVFQKIYDEIKYLCKIVTAGSKEARELERVKKAFEDAYRADNKAEGGTKYSLSDNLNPMQSQMVNIMAANIVSEARKNNLSLERYYSATEEINAYSPTKADALLIADSLEPIVKQLDNENFRGYLDRIRSYSEDFQYSFDSNQIKSTANAKPTGDPDIRFSLSEAVEETKDLMALHNLTEQKLLKSLKLGGLPMPSVAIARAQDGHGEFGEISLILPKDAIDPQTSSRNKLYSGDAWTPTYPRVEYKLNEKALKTIRKKVDGLVPYEIQEFGRLHLDSDNMEDTLNRYNGDVVEAFKDNDALKYAYLMEAGAEVDLPMKEKNLSYSGSRENGAIIKVAEAIPADEISKALNGGYEEVQKLEPIVRKAVAEYVRETYGDDQFILDTFAPAEGLSFSDLDGYLTEARKYLRKGIEKTVDTRPAKELIRDMTVQYSYEEWLSNLFSGIVEKEGIRNNKDYFTPSGNRRSFEALHYEHNLENVIKAMREKGEKGIGFGGGSIFGASTTEFSSVDEMKQASDRLQKMSEEEYQEIKDGFSNRFFELASSLPNNKGWSATDDAANTLTEAVSKYSTRSGIANYLRRELKGWATYSEQVVDDLIELVNDIRKMPTGYFEAKPQRAVTFDEVGVFVIPNNADVKLKQELLNRGYAIAEYDPNIEGHRQQVVNQFEEYKFSLSEAGEQPRRYGDYNIYGKDIGVNDPLAEFTQGTVSKTENVADVAKNATTTAMFPDDLSPMSEDESSTGERLASLEDAPPEAEAPYYGEEAPVAPGDPFADRDYKDVGKKNVKAYMYEHPEFKPFFQMQAKAMLGDLQNSVKGKRWYNDDVYYATNGEDGWGGTERQTTDDIAYLLDNGYTYAQIEYGLKAIIEDNGAENIAIAKRIEFALNDRLRKGYTDINGFEIPANQDYINTMARLETAEAVESQIAPHTDADAPVEDIAPTKVPTAVNPYDSMGAAPYGFDPITQLQYKYGNLPDGEHPVREDSMPKSITGKDKVSLTARTVKGAGATPDEFVDLLHKETLGGRFSYIPIKNSDTVQKAYDEIVKKGWEAARGEWAARVRRGEVSAELTATGSLLLNHAAKAGDRTAWLDVLHDYQIMGTNAGQAVQAMRILKTLTPDDSLYMIERSVEQMVEDMKLGTEIVIDDNLKQNYLNAKTDGERDAARKALAENIAKQIPSTAMDKWTALRYLNMLGNFRTQVRNIIGNLGMSVTTGVRNSVATSIEWIANKASGGKFHRTKSIFVNKGQLKAARNDFENVKTVALNGGKFNDPMAKTLQFQQEVQDARKIFKIAPLEWYRRGTNWAMDTGDLVFSKVAYGRALAGYLKANGIKETDFSKIDQQTLDEARAYAIKEAQETTFRDNNWLSSWVSKLGRGKNTPKGVKIVSEGVMPFRKTPANILLRAEEYSPLGLVNATVKSIQAAKGNVTGADVVNSWAKALTGTGLFALGMWLNNSGMLSGGPDEDDDKEWFEDQYGWQNYAIQIGDHNFTIDFLSPAAMPLLMGAQLNELRQNSGIELKDLEKALLSIADPMIEMSMLQGVSDTLDNIRYAESNMGQFFVNACVSYLTQGLTNSFLGQLERSVEGQRMSTFTDKDSDLPAWLQKALGKASAKTPGWDYQQIPYIDAWGETEDIAPLPGLAENTLSPSYISQGITDAVYEELNRLNDAQSDINVYPQTPDKTVTFDDAYGNRHEDYNLSAEEYVELAQLQGQTQKELVEDILSNYQYSGLNDQEKARAVQLAYQYAKEYSRQEVLGADGFSADWMKRADAKGDIVNAIIAHTNDEKTFAYENPEKYQFFTESGISWDDYDSADEDTKREYSNMYTWVSDEDHPGRYSLAKAVSDDFQTFWQYRSDCNNFDAKDENGETVNGLKKERVIDYINSLDIDYGARLILFRSMYDGKKDKEAYDQDIVDYLNSRDDLTYEDMEAILKELG